jgi:heme A synthase
MQPGMLCSVEPIQFCNGFFNRLLGEIFSSVFFIFLFIFLRSMGQRREIFYHWFLSEKKTHVQTLKLS